MLLDVSGYDPDTYQRPTSEFSDLRDFNIKYEGGDDTQIVKYIQENLDSQFDSSLFDFDEIEIIPGDHSSLMLIYTKWGILFIICVIPVGLFFKYLLYSSVNFKSLIWTYVILVIVYLIAYFLTLHTKKEDR